MELFYSANVSAGGTTLDSEESAHCIKVLRHRSGDSINVVDGHGMLYRCTILDDNPRAVSFRIDESVENYGSHDYRLHMAVAPPKNPDRFVWFAEKATEIGVDCITPLFGDYSERKIFKPERVERILISAAKQSHKGTIPTLNPAVSVRQFIEEHSSDTGARLICYCDEAEGKTDIMEALRGADRATIMIGPEGDFSRSEISLALSSGWKTVSLGDSRLRIETAAVTATAAMYLLSIGKRQHKQ